MSGRVKPIIRPSIPISGGTARLVNAPCKTSTSRFRRRTINDVAAAVIQLIRYIILPTKLSDALPPSRERASATAAATQTLCRTPCARATARKETMTNPENVSGQASLAETGSRSVDVWIAKDSGKLLGINATCLFRHEPALSAHGHWWCHETDEPCGGRWPVPELVDLQEGEKRKVSLTANTPRSGAERPAGATVGRGGSHAD